MEIHGTLTSKGQITLPKDIRAALGLVPGDTVSFALGARDCVTLRKAAPLPSLAGILRRFGTGKTLSDAAIRDAIIQATKPQ